MKNKDFKKITKPSSFFILKLFVKFKKTINKKLFKDIRNVILVLLCSFLFLTLWVNRVKFYPENIVLWFESKIATIPVGAGFPCYTEGEKTASENFKFSDSNIIALSDTSLNIVSSSGNIVRCEKHNFSHPCLKCGDIRSIIYDRGGKDFKIESLSKNLYSGATKKDIIAGAIADNGTFAIAEQSTTHLAEMGVYNKSGKEKYRFSFSDYYISDIALNALGQQGTACGISAEDGKISSNVYILDFKSETPKYQLKLTDNMVTRVEYMAGGNILAIGDKYMSFINSKSGAFQNFTYENKLLKFYDFNKNSGICCCFSSSVNETDGDEIVMINTTGQEVSRFQTLESFLGISHRGNRTLGLTQDKITSYSFTGKAEGYIKIQTHAKKIILSPHSYAYTLGSGSIGKVKIAHLEK